MPHSKLQKILSTTMSILLAFSVLNHSLFAINHVWADGESFITGKTFYDANKNGVNDLGDSVLPFLKVSLFQGSSVVQGPNSIDSTGNYSFTIITPGSYHVSFTNLPPNYSFSAPNLGGDDMTDSDVNNDGIGMGSTDDIILVGGETIANVDAGAYVDNVIVGDYAWFDADSDGIQDISESGAEAIEVELQDQNTNTTLGSDTTDNTGHYGISATLPACIGPNEFWESGDSDMTCSNVNVSGGYYELTFTTSPDCESNSISISLEAADSSPLFSNSCGSSEGQLRNSTSYNFRIGPEGGTGQAHLRFTESGSSQGIGNIELIYQKNRVSFSNVPPGQSFSASHSGGDNTVDSDVDTGGFTGVLELATGEVYNNVDAGICTSPCTPPAPSGSASIGNFIWNDTNSNGLQDVGELGIGGVSISLYRTSDNQFLGSTSSNMSGAYSITSIPAGTYYIQVGSIPPGYNLTINDANSNSNDDMDSDANQMTGFSSNFSLIDAQVKTDLDVGLVSSGGGGGGPSGSGRISGMVFSDNNNNGIYEPEDDENFWMGVNITLYRASNDSMVSGQGSGNSPYEFTNLADGDYYIIFGNLPPDGSFSSQDQGSDDTIDSDVDGDGRTALIHIENGEAVENINAGIYAPGGGGGGDGSDGAIRAHIFTDNDGNGYQNDEDSDGASGITITLSNGEDSVELEMNEDGDINMTLPENLEGYTISFDLPAGTYVTAHSNPWEDIVVFGGQLTDLGNIGIYTGTAGSFSLFLFTDYNGNGSQDEDEPNGASKVYIAINDSQESLIPFPTGGFLSGYLAPGMYSFTIFADYTEQELSFTGDTAGLETVQIFANLNNSLGAIGFHLEGGGGGGGECEESCGHIEIELFGDTNGNGSLDGGEIHDVDGAQLRIEGDNDIDMTIPFDPEGRVGGDVGVGTYTLTILLPEGFEITGGENPFSIEVTDGSDNSYRRGARHEDGDEGDCEADCGRILLHVFTDTNNNGTQQTWEPSSASGTTVHIQGGDIDEVVSLAGSGDVGGDVPNGTYTFTITPPTGSIVTGGSNPIIFIVTTNSDTTVIRGIYVTSGSSSGGGGGGGSVIYGGSGGGTSGSSSNWSSSSSSSGNRSSTNSNRSSSNTNTTTNPPTATSPTNEPSNTLPTVTPIFTPCLITSGISPIDFYDSNLAETDYLSSIIFQNNHANRLVHGDGNGSFAGSQPMTRFELLKVALGSNCVAGGNFVTPNSSFTDVNTDTSEQSRVIGEAHNRGIIQGQNNQFYPNRPVTLGELIKILLGSSAYFPNGQPVQNLVVTESGITEPTFIQPIEYAKFLGILEQSGPINQNEIVTRDQMAIIIARYIRAMNDLVISQ